MVLRDSLIYLSRQRQLGNVITTVPLARHFATRFVAGETLDQAIAVVRALNERRIRASLDHLGESVGTVTEAIRAANACVEILDRIAAEGVDSNLSLKLTQMGIDLDPRLARANLVRVLDAARAHGNFVRIDMEDSAHVQPTLDLYRALHPDYANVGVVIQAYLYRSRRDVEELVAEGARVRLVKGAYAEGPGVAFPAKADVDRSYAELMERLLLRGTYPAIATHDERLIRQALAFAEKQEIDRTRFEFQMLYGIRRDLQEELARTGHNVRVYVPFGAEWYPYLMRRLAERPANLGFLISNVFRG
jgi:proline dehydrogenase